MDTNQETSNVISIAAQFETGARPALQAVPAETLSASADDDSGPLEEATSKRVAYGANPHDELQRLKWLSDVYGDLCGWTSDMVAAVIENTKAMQRDLVQRTHRANVRRLRAVVEAPRCWDPQLHWLIPTMEELDALEDPSKRSEILQFDKEYVVVVNSQNCRHELSEGILQGPIVGSPLFTNRQIVYALAKPTPGGYCQLTLPPHVLWLSKTGIDHMGEVCDPLLDDVVFTAAGVIVPLEVRLVPQTFMGAIDLQIDEYFDLSSCEPPSDLLGRFVVKPLPVNVFDPEDGRNVSCLPELLRVPVEEGYSAFGDMDAAAMVRVDASMRRGLRAMKATVPSR